MLIYQIENNGMIDDMEVLTGTAIQGLNIIGSFVLCFLALVFLVVAILFVIDVTQTKDAVRRNYPVLGRFRGGLTKLGEFFRQYFFAMDREEMPFNRAQRDYINDIAQDGKEVVPFGSTQVLSPGTPIFANGLYPKLAGQHEVQPALVIGKGTPNPYAPTSLFNISAMSYGALSKPAVQALSHGAQMAGCWLNTGEGGVAPYHKEGECDLVYQLGTGKFGARKPDGSLDAEKLAKVCENPNIKMIELKLSQGAKPGKGGILPGEKVTAEIAEIRGIEIGESAISPNRHVDAGSPEELLDLIENVRKASGRPTGIKFVVGNIAPIHELFEAIKARGIDSAPDFITVDSGDGGTGAAPQPLMDNVGLAIREGLPLIDDLLREEGLRERVALIASGKLVTPVDVAWAFCVGADFVTSARGFMFALGCIQALKCNENTCPTGITTHNKRLQRGLDPTNKAVRVMNYAKTLQKEVEMIAHSCGVDHPRDLTREHVLIVQAGGRSIPFSQSWNKSRYI